MNTIDTHSHFNLEQFSKDREEAIKRMYEAGVGTICVGIDMHSSDFACELASTNDSIWACVGQHPTEWQRPFDTDKMRTLGRQAKVVANGECGLDYYREAEREAKETQKELFLKQILLAQELDLPLMLHIRPQDKTMDAYEDALIILESYKKQWPTMRGTAHFFVGSIEIADRFLALGFHISFSGVITFVSEYEKLVSHVPLDRILSETDAPFAAPAPHRGKRNEPAYVLEVVKKIGEIKGVSLEKVRAQLFENAKSIFKLNT